jgi:prepilin-type N-terminal cleavage/methylation domain-containing protein
MSRHSIVWSASQPAGRRTAFTLVELLVVITIIGMLMALLMPAVQSAREAGRRTACSNNITQLALAAIRSDEQSGFIPGWRNKHPNPTNTTTVSWPVPLLPFMERSDVYKNWAENPSPARPSISFFMCATTPPDNPNDPWLAYGGNCGSGSGASGRWDGVMGDTTVAANARMSFEDVANGDGTPTTILLSERCGRVTMAFWSTTGFGATPSPFFTSANTAIPGFGIFGSPPAKIINSQVDGAPGYRSQPSSNHAGGVVTAYCDGHAGFLKDSIAGQVYAQLLSSNGALASTLSQNEWKAGSYVVRESDYQ